ncbi:hypothetical protein [Marinobacter xestospongiae]|uniref:Pre-peptidase C-terminal domain-containing protein n=1 Tax=Marinobacter xestospongiae TaxID=994319 RepID=A0ABU3W326_9GAMM|nr:hypothetical protein [Marinobacter xestospongiae]MDV2080940.1 hypothetical protein [Marinobacter xestospongiae]
MKKNVSSLVLGGVAVTLLAGCQALQGPSAGGVGTQAAVSAPGKLVVGERARGELTTQSGLNLKDGSRYAQFNLNLDADELVEIELDGSVVGSLALYNSQNELMANASPLYFKVEDAGQYTLVVSGADANTYGPFSLNSRTLELNQVSSLVPEDSISDWMTDGGNSYTLTITEAGGYQIDMTSDVVDAMLILEGPGGYESQDDDGGEGYNARLGDILEPGEYTLTATSYDATPGLYDLSVSKMDVDLTEMTGGPIDVPTEVTGWMRSGPDIFTFTVEEEGLYQIDMRSDTLDSLLTLEGPNGFSTEDDDGGSNYNAQITTRLVPGDYHITASSYDDSRGIYTLSVIRR